VNAADSNGETLLQRAVIEGYGGIIEVLAAAGADLNAKDGSGNTPLYIAARAAGHIDAVKALVKAGADVNARDHDSTALALGC